MALRTYGWEDYSDGDIASVSGGEWTKQSATGWSYAIGTGGDDKIFTLDDNAAFGDSEQILVENTVGSHSGDFDILTKLSIETVSGLAATYPIGVGFANASGNYYACVYEGSGNWSLYYYQGGSQWAQVGSTATGLFTPSNGVSFWIHLNRTSGTVQAKIWGTSYGSQPGSWSISASDSSVTTGKAAIIGYDSSAGAIIYEYVSVASSTDSAAEPVTYTLEQDSFAIGDDDGSESTYTLGTENSNRTIALSTNFIVRSVINATDDPPAIAYTLKAQKNGTGGYSTVRIGSGNYTDMSVIGAGAQSVSTTSGGTLSPAYPAGYTAVANDTCILIAAGKHNNGSSLAPSDPGSYSQLNTSFREIGTYDLQITVWAKKLTASEAAPSLTVPAAYSTTSGGLSAQILILRGGDTTTLADATAVASDSAAADTWAHTGITSATNGAMIISAVASADDNALELLSGSEQGFTARMNGASYDTTTGGDHAVGVATKVQTTAGAVTMPTWDQTAVGTDAWVGIAVAIKPQAVTPQIYVSPSSNITAGGEATTNRLTSGVGSFVTGRIWDNENGTDTIDITSGNFTELAMCCAMQSPAVATDYFDFRWYEGDTALDTYTSTPRVTVAGGGGATITKGRRTLLGVGS